jgi:hypothetical protein
MGRRLDDGRRDGWTERFRRRETSGLTVAPFCEWEGLSVAPFYSWQKKLRVGKSGGGDSTFIATRISRLEVTRAAASGC